MKATREKVNSIPRLRTHPTPQKDANNPGKARSHYWLALLLVALTLAVFWRVQNHEFVWDDEPNVEKNQYLKPVTLSNMARFWTSPFENLYAPLTYTAWSAVAYLSQAPPDKNGEVQLDPRWFHAANLGIHTVTVLAVFALLRCVAANDWAAGAGAVLFGLHPVQVEPVAWITGLKDVLSGLFSVIALWQYLVSVKDGVSAWFTSKPSFATIPAGNTAPKNFVSRKNLHYGIATVAFALALLAKPAAVVVPLMAWVLDYAVVRRSIKQSVTFLGAWFLIAIPFVVLAKSQQPDSLLTVVTPLWERPVVAADAVAFYLYKLFVPVSLGPGYGRSPEIIFEEGWAYASWIIPVGAGVAIWYLRRRCACCVAAAGLFIAGLLPVLGFVQFQFQNWSTVADRYLYLSMLGPALAVSCAVSGQWAKRKSLAIACAAVLLSLAIKSAYQTEIWRNSETLWRYALAIGQDSAVAHANLGASLTDANLDEAIYQLHQAVALAPEFADAYFNLGIVLAKRGEFRAAAENYRTVLKLRPEYPNARYFLALALERSGNLDEAIEHFRLAVKANPDDPAAHNSLANALADRGLLDEAIEQYGEVMRIKPNFAGAYFNLALVFEQRGDLDKAAGHYIKALQRNPDHANAHNNLAVVLERQGHLEESIEHFREALRIEPDFPEAQRGLARVLSEAKKAKIPGN